MAELSVGQIVDKVIENLDKEFTRQARNYATSKLREAASQFISDELVRLVPGASFFTTAVGNLPGDAAGKLFQGLLEEFVFKYANEVPGLQNIWFEPKVAYDGTTKADGFSTSTKASFNPIGYYNNTWPRPDFIFSTSRPIQDNSGAADRRASGVELAYARSLLVGDFKLRQQNAYDDAVNDSNQFQAIVYHASIETMHQWVPVGLYLTLFGGPKSQEETIEKRSLQDGAYVIVVSLT